MVKKAEKYIRTNLKKNVLIRELCEMVGTTEQTLCLGFKERFGLSPNTYMQTMPLKYATKSYIFNLSCDIL